MLQGLRPAAHGAPVAIVSYYLYTKNKKEIFVQVILKASHAPCALERGQGWRKGGCIS